MIITKLVILDLLKIKVIGIKDYGIINSVLYGTNKILSSDSNYKDLTRKNNFFEGRSWVKFDNLGLAPGTALKCHTSVVKILKLKVKEIFGLIKGAKLVGAFLPLPILNMVKVYK